MQQLTKKDLPCVAGIFLLVIILLTMSEGEYFYPADTPDEADKVVCVINLRIGCKNAPETYQVMVVVRGQLLALPSRSNELSRKNLICIFQNISLPPVMTRYKN